MALLFFVYNKVSKIHIRLIILQPERLSVIFRRT